MDLFLPPIKNTTWNE